MKTVYFDSYVYNRLVEEKVIKKQILKLNYDKKIEVFFSDYLFNELTCTFINDPAKGRKISEIVLKLISDKILKQRESLINKEIIAFLNNAQKVGIFYSPEKSSEVIGVVNRMTRENPTNNRPLLEVIEAKKKNYQKIKDIIKEHQDKVDFGVFSNFEDYCNNPKFKAEEDQFINKFLSQKIIKDSIDEKTIQKIKNNRNNLPHFDAYLKVSAAYQFALMKRKNNDQIWKKPCRGDDYDMRHFVSAATLDILVCDREFLKILKWAYPNKCCVILDDFFDLFK